MTPCSTSTVPLGMFDDKNVGTGKTVTVTGLTLTGNDATNYVITPPTATADITSATLIVGGLAANNKPYDGNNTASLNTSGITLVGVSRNDNVTLSTTNLAGTFATKNVGDGQVVTVTGLTISGPDAGNYTLIIPALTADITPAVLTVTGITAGNKVYDATTADRS